MPQPRAQQERQRARAVAQRPQCSQRLDTQQPLLGALVGLLEIQPRRIDTARDVPQATAEQLSAPRRNRAGSQLRDIVALAPYDKRRAGEPTLELRPHRRHLRLDAPEVGYRCTARRHGYRPA
jgi:hypothetical protein